WASVTMAAGTRQRYSVGEERQGVHAGEQAQASGSGRGPGGLAGYRRCGQRCEWRRPGGGGPAPRCAPGGPGEGAPDGPEAGGGGGGQGRVLVEAGGGEFGVPAGLLLAISYDQTRWDRPGGSPSVDGGFGLMDLTASTSPPTDGRGDPAQPAPRKVTLPRTHFTLDEAARLLHVRRGTLIASERQNIRGAAAVLAHYAREL